MRISVHSVLSVLLATLASLSAEPKTYTVKFEENLPQNASAWHLRMKERKGEGWERRFGPYDPADARALSDDALVDRGSDDGKAPTESAGRATAFAQAYDGKGWYIYIEGKEPLIQEMVGNVIDPASPVHREAYEIFFTPGLKKVPYYQIFVHPYLNQFRLFDWGMPGPRYRSLKDGIQVESTPLEDGIGTLVFIPWYLLYERVPLNGEQWRFTVIRWMPYSRTSGVTWSGQVHATGDFGLVRFASPTPEQKKAIQSELLRYTWFKFNARRRAATERWSDHRLGDPEFYEKEVQPAAERLAGLMGATSNLDEWSEEQRQTGIDHLGELMEFDYMVSGLRSRYLREQRLKNETASNP